MQPSRLALILAKDPANQSMANAGCRDSFASRVMDRFFRAQFLFWRVVARQSGVSLAILGIQFSTPRLLKHPVHNRNIVLRGLRERGLSRLICNRSDGSLWVPCYWDQARSCQRVWRVNGHYGGPN